MSIFGKKRKKKKDDPKELQFSGLVQKYHRKENANNKNV